MSEKPKYNSYIAKIEQVTDTAISDGLGWWENTNFTVSIPKIGETWCFVTKHGYFHMAFRVE